MEHEIVKKDRQREIADEMEREAQIADDWEIDAAPTAGKNTLGTQVTIRLDGRDAARLRRIAAIRRIGYTSLLREWIQDRLRAEETSEAGLIIPRISQNGYTVTRSTDSWITGTVRWMTPHGAELARR